MDLHHYDSHDKIHHTHRHHHMYMFPNNGTKILSFRPHLQILIRSNRRWHSGTFRLIERIINNRTIINRHFPSNWIHPRQRMFTPMLVKCTLFLILRRFTIIILINTILEIFPSMSAPRFLSIFRPCDCLQTKQQLFTQKKTNFIYT